MARREVDPPLPGAAERAAAMAAMVARGHGDPSRRYRRLGLVAGGAMLSVGLLWLSLSSFVRREPPKRAEPAEAIDDSHYLSPIKTATAGPGEEEAPFSGFAISVDTEPPGALVSIAGVPRGEAPVLANVGCKPGAPLEVRAEKAGLPPARRETTCRADTLLKLTIRLGP